ncbi:sterigmatocystin 8-o-methyltransferase [Colletotrichum incanum]|uniref:Sterigmatocystin 8-o-methyltransferase n=1 Tax=Colletotrichum incanum TaxID=1573173 RepID=A0A167B2Z0_COLIC|nr:sterigmatocystin 8-o-methyltransferase [Colletotrichum incanum]OHW94191.1 o-methyltransferase [Colletotrichum incanum]
MASGANKSDSVQAFLRAANEIVNSIENDNDRASVLLKLYELVNRVESPWETFMRLYLSQPATSAALKVLKDSRLFERWRLNGNSPLTSSELAGLTDGCDPALLHRLLRHLAANHLVGMTSDGKYKPTSFSTKLAEPDFSTTAQFYSDYLIPMFNHMPEFIARTGYENPKCSRKTIFDSTFNWEGGAFEYWKEHPAQGEVFNIVQKTLTSIQTRWTSIYPSHMLLEGDPHLPLLVDVGGSVGHDVQCFIEKHPGTASRLYLEDIPSVIADEKSTVVKGINKVPYDFFTPQPIKHARAYYMHHIIHGWPNRQARKILEMQKAAMKPGYSKLLIHEHIMNDDRPVHPYAAAFDIGMMLFASAQERTEREWESLITSAGLKIVKIWRVPSAAKGVIEAELASERSKV